MKRKSTVLRIIENLKVLYPDAICSLTYQKDYELLFATRLSAQCTDARVNQVTPELFSTYPTLEALAEASVEDVGRIIHSCGLYQTKARDLVACARVLLEKHGGKVPDTMDELTALPGVGRKTANLVLGDIFHKPAVVADTHCIHHRPVGSDRRQQRPRSGRKTAARRAPAGGEQRLLPPHGSAWPCGMHGPQPCLWRVPSEKRL